MVRLTQRGLSLCVRTRSSLRDLNRLFRFFPALPRWAKLVRPSGAGFSGIARNDKHFELGSCCGVSSKCKEKSAWFG